MDQEKEAAVFFPEAERVKVGDRTYEIRALKLKQMRLLIRLARLDLKSINEDTITAMVDGIAEIIGEKNKDWLEENLDVGTVKEIFLKVRKTTYAGVPEVKEEAGQKVN